VVAVERPRGVIVQFGGQTPLKLARSLEAAGVPIIGTSPDSIDLAEDRERFQRFLHEVGLRQPPNRTVRHVAEATARAAEIGYPLVVRPSYVLGGRAMEIVYDDRDLENYMHAAVSVSNDSPVLLDRFLDSAIEIDVDAICDGADVLIGGIMEHIEQAGVHSVDSACALPPHTLGPAVQAELRRQVEVLARGLGVIGLMNVQFAIQGSDIYVLEVNPRASRTAPFVSKAIGLSLPYVAARCMIGESLTAQGCGGERIPGFYSVKEAVFPFAKFPGVDPLLGPEMKSTGEVMGIGATFGEAFGKAQQAANMPLPVTGTAFVSVRDADKPGVVTLARRLLACGFRLVATKGTAAVLRAAAVECEQVNKVLEGHPHIVDMIKNDEIDLIINTTEGKQAIADSYAIRINALQHRIAYTTTMAGATAAVMALGDGEHAAIRRLQDLHREFVA
jgi:carbamoyl-phosphate synthase large subunit